MGVFLCSIYLPQSMFPRHIRTYQPPPSIYHCCYLHAILLLRDRIETGLCVCPGICVCFHVPERVYVCVCVFLCFIASIKLRALQYQTHSIEALITGWKYQLYNPYSPRINRESKTKTKKE